MLTELYEPIESDLAQVRQVFDTELSTDLPFISAMCDTIRSYRGKMLRPALLLLAGKASGEMTEDHRTLAAVVEMVHMATLVHDDVLDEATERRAQPTIATVSGNVAAVLLGDFLISHAFHLCSSLKSQHASRRIGATTNTVCEGELLQNYYINNADLDEATYFDIIRKKTGSLTAVACELGAHASGGDEQTAKSMYNFGMSAGLAFQIVDDVLDIIGSERDVGKTLGVDLAMGKLTLPTIHCLTTADSSVHELLSAAVHDRNGVSLAALRSWLIQTESISYALSVANRCVDDALQALEVLPNSEAKRSLQAMATFIVKRAY